MITTDSLEAVAKSVPGWLSPEGVFHQVKRLTIGHVWPHAEWAHEQRPDSDDGEQALMGEGWWKCSVSLLGDSVTWMADLDATPAQRVYLLDWSRRCEVTIHQEDFYGKKRDQIDPADRVQVDGRKRTPKIKEVKESEPPVLPRPPQEAVFIDTLPVALTVPLDVRVSEVDGRSFIGARTACVRNLAPLSGDTPDGAMSIVADFSFGFHITRYKGERTYEAHVSLADLARLIDSQILGLQKEHFSAMPDAGTRPIPHG